MGCGGIRRQLPADPFMPNRVKSGSSLSALAYGNIESKRKVMDIAAILGKVTGLAFVDCSAISETIGVLNQVVDMGCCILANKKPLTSTMEDYEKLISYPRRLPHESTVHWEMLRLKSEVEDGKSLSEVVKASIKILDSLNQASSLFAADPRDVLRRMDVARKVAQSFRDVDACVYEEIRAKTKFSIHKACFMYYSSALINGSFEASVI